MNREVAAWRKKLIIAGLGVMLVGLTCAGLIYLSAGDDSENVLGYEIIGGSAYPIRPDDSKIYKRNLELYGGGAAVLADQFGRWFAGLWRGRSLAVSVAVISIFISFVFFFAGTQRMSSVLVELLFFSRMKKADMSITEIDVNKLVSDVWGEIREMNQERSLEVKITKLLNCFGDPILIRQVFFNLVSNAVKFTGNRKPGIIEISSYKDSAETVYSVKDNGVGFNMFYYDKLFGVFQRLHSPAEYSGTGLGLALVSRLVLRHGGRVWAESEVDGGATFYFSLPCAS
jgi:signal transduction histidine kinase